jgi:CelD/BcsL family acetyltransferase involved in cellulose biosynthesis
MAKLSERTARFTIGMMRSMASHVPISPFHLAAADEMEKLLNEVLEYRKEKNERSTTKRMGKSLGMAQASDDSEAA